ncbi:MAG: hypothetical protein ACTHJW_00450 [Streptosporangiaceae bacterium]
MTANRRQARADTERQLRDLAQAIDTGAPDYSERVLRVLAAQDRRPARANQHGPGNVRRVTRRRVLTAIAVLLVASAVAIAIPGSRRALAQWFGFSGITIQHTKQTPTPPPSTALPVPLHAGNKVTLGRASVAMAGQLTLPARLPAPSSVYLRRDGGAVVVTLAYSTAPHLLPTADSGYALILTEIARAGRPLFMKMLGPGAKAKYVTVRGNRGVYLDGPQQIVTVDYAHPRGGQPQVHEISARTSADTIIWSNGATTFRLEGDFGRRAAVLLAGTVQRHP